MDGWVGERAAGWVGGLYGLFDLFPNYLHLILVRCPGVRGW